MKGIILGGLGDKKENHHWWPRLEGGGGWRTTVWEIRFLLTGRPPTHHPPPTDLLGKRLKSTQDNQLSKSNSTEDSLIYPKVNNTQNIWNLLLQIQFAVLTGIFRSFWSVLELVVVTDSDSDSLSIGRMQCNQRDVNQSTKQSKICQPTIPSDRKPLIIIWERVRTVSFFLTWSLFTTHFVSPVRQSTRN